MRGDTGWRLFIRSVIARAYPRIIGSNRDKTWLFFDTFLPLVVTIGYVFAYRAMQAPQDYIGFVVMGGAMLAFWMNVMWAMSAQLYWEKDSGNLALYIMAPNSLMAVLMGMALGGMLATTLRAGIIVVTGALLFHVPFSVSSFGQLFAVFTLTMAALYGLGMLFSSLFLLWGRNAFQLNKMMEEPIYFVSGLYFPVRNLGFPLAIASSIIPLTLGLDAMRQLVFASGSVVGIVAVRVEIGALIALSVLLIGLARYALNYMERLAIREGSLTDRRR